MTNRLLSIIAKKIFCHFDETRGLKDKYNSKKIVSGNPIRQSIQYRKPVISDEVHVLVFGGSLGATQINDMISTLVEDGFKDRELHILHQVGKGNKFEIGPLGPNIKSYKQHEYIDDMQKAYEWSNVIISRAGASTVSELSIVKKPCILVPYPAATHNHQEINAEIFKKEADFFVGVTNYRLNRTDLTQQVKELLKTSLNHLEKIHHSSQTETAIDIILKEIS
jgi:UDP-N-acetylglucosamine--N-acetylmuramyl-(pentapeptide) pyrophosphoryl-undecaprenol N-acetylglucosamine transferase